jgi:hypothetical protein
VSPKRTPVDALREARRRDSLAKRTRVLAIVDEMKSQDERITFLGVARAAGVSSWLVYAAGVREHIEAAREDQAARMARKQHSGATASSASPTADQVSAAELAVRIEELTTRFHEWDAKLDAARASVARLEAQLEQTLDQIAGLRTALRQMTRQQNTG